MRPVVVTLSPSKKNLSYSVGTFTTFSETFKPLLDRLKKERGGCPRTILYCQSFNTCADIYIYLARGLGLQLTEAMDALNIPRFRLVNMYTSVTDQHHKDEIISLFTKPSQLRVVIATIAFGLDLIVLMCGRSFTLDCQKTLSPIFRKLDVQGEMEGQH